MKTIKKIKETNLVRINPHSYSAGLFYSVFVVYHIINFMIKI